VSDKATGSKGIIPQTLVDVAIAAALVGSVFLAMFAFSGNWPPLVVIESKSMQHSGDESQIGVLDTGDLAMVKSVSSMNEITTYAGGLINGHRTYGDFGDVIIYWKAGDQTETPIIHRAVIFLDANDDDSFSAPELQYLAPGVDYVLTNSSDSWDHLTSDFHMLNYGFRGADISIPITNILRFAEAHGEALRGGFITKGDYNTFVDQLSYISVGEPVPFEWVHGVATGEIPWFGVVKLWFTGSLPQDAPGNSITLLWVSVIAIAAIPIGSEVYIWVRDRRKAGQKDPGPEEKPPIEKPKK